MQIIHRLDELRAQLHTWRVTRERVAFVPTMGNLHDGHIELVRLARDVGDQVIVSIFVNPLQFGEGEDYERYPRTLEADAVRLREVGADVVFAPSVNELYPDGPDISTEVRVRGLSDELCGKFRPGHFAGVTTVVNLLLNLVQPRFAIFGEKDYQQLVLIRRMARDLHMDVEIIGGPTIREKSGLAMSSRNAYLDDEQRESAAAIYQVLAEIVAELRRGERNFSTLCKNGEKKLRDAGLNPQYLEIRGSELEAATEDSRDVVVLAAAEIGTARLIDNVRVQL